MTDEQARVHLVNAAAPAVLRLMHRVEAGQVSAEDAVAILQDWPNLASGPTDWPARFRAAAEVADEARYVGTQSDLRRLAGQLASLAICDPQVVEGIGRALLGEAP